MFSEQDNQQLLERIQTASSIIIVVHRNPDGDALGSSLGLQHFLKESFQKSAMVVVPDAFPDFLNWMPGSDSIFVADNQAVEAEKLLNEADVIFCLDFNDASRVAALEKPLSESKAFKVMIDHHRNPSGFCDLVYSDISASSTSEMVLRWIVELKKESLLNKDMASCLYTGIMTDTGSFRFESCTSVTHRMVALLLDTGIEHWTIHELLSNQNSLEKLQLWGLAFKDKLVHLPEYRTAYIYLTEKELQSHQYKEGDLEGLVNFALSIKNTLMGVLFSERNGRIRISFRSVGSFPVNELSSKHFSGGGHLNAAGGVSDLSLNETVEKFKALLSEYPQLKP